MLKKQQYGVEIEFTGISRAKAADVVADVLNAQASAPGSNCYQTRTITDSQGRKWKVMRDSSINPQRFDGTNGYLDEYRVEFVTPPLTYGDIELLQNIVRKLRGAGAKTNGSCGIHVHVDGANHTAESLRRMVNFMVSRQDIFNEALENSGRSDWCRKLDRNLLNEMKKKRNITLNEQETIWYSPANSGYNGGVNHEHYNQTRYHGLNLHSFFSKGTVEFRLFNSTLHAGKIKAYIQLCLAISAWAITSNGPVVFRSMDGYTAEQKVTIMRNILTHRLGLTGEEFKTCRLHIMTPLKKAARMSCRHAA